MQNCTVEIKDNKTVLTIDNNTVLRKKFAEIIAESNNFETIGKDANYEYGLKMVMTRRKVKSDNSIASMANSL